MSEHAESVAQFRSELQRVGRQLGNILNIMEKGNTSLLVQLNENFGTLTTMVDRQAQSMSSVSDSVGRMTEDSAITRRGMLEMMRFMQSLMLQQQAEQGNTAVNPPTRPNP
jgi:phage shock protein A